MTEESTSVADQVRLLMEQRGWSYAQVAMRAGVDPTTIWKIATGKTPNPGNVTLRKIGEAFGVDLSTPSTKQSAPGRRSMVVPGVVAVPVMRARVQASGRPDWADTYETVATISTRDPRRDERLLAAIVTGICMEPHVSPGDRVIFDPERREPADGQMVVVVDGEGATLVKYFRVDDLGRPYLRAADGTEIRPNGARVVGTVIDIVRRPGRDPESLQP